MAGCSCGALPPGGIPVAGGGNTEAASLGRVGAGAAAGFCLCWAVLAEPLEAEPLEAEEKVLGSGSPMLRMNCALAASSSEGPSPGSAALPPAGPFGCRLRCALLPAAPLLALALAAGLAPALAAWPTALFGAVRWRLAAVVPSAVPAACRFLVPDLAAGFACLPSGERVSGDGVACSGFALSAVGLADSPMAASASSLPQISSLAISSDPSLSVMQASHVDIRLCAWGIWHMGTPGSICMPNACMLSSGNMRSSKQILQSVFRIKSHQKIQTYVNRQACLAAAL